MSVGCIAPLPRPEAVSRSIVSYPIGPGRDRQHGCWQGGEMQDARRAARRAAGHAITSRGPVAPSSRGAAPPVLCRTGASPRPMGLGPPHSARVNAPDYRTIVEDLTELICRLRPDGTVLFANASLCRFLGRRQEEVVGQPLWPFLPEGDGERCRRLLASLTPEHPFCHIEQRVVPPEGRAVWYQWACRATFDSEGGSIALQLAGREITRMHEVQEQREDLLRAVSHDLRTPLTVVRGNAQLLQRSLAAAGRSNEQVRVQAILKSVEQMTAMTQDLVDGVRLEAGQIRLQAGPLRLAHFLADWRARMGTALNVDRIRLEVPDDLPPVLADPHRLERIVTNLVSNALRYSPADREAVLRARTAAGQAIISVADRGLGIPPEELPLVFLRFYRASPAGQEVSQSTDLAEGKGLGIGLHITRILVEAHGGRLWAESEPGVGSTFCFTLPLA